MDEIIREAMGQAQAQSKPLSSVPWKQDEPWAQPWHVWAPDKDCWKPANDTESLAAEYTSPSGIGCLAIFSWNIDFMLPFPKARMDAALAHLEKLTKEVPTTTAIVILLQECLPSDLATLGEKQWIRDGFYLTDVDSTSWASGAYGTTMLVDRRLTVSSCFRVHHSATQMERDGLFVDVANPTTESAETIRLCNTHLESLAIMPPRRPAQMRLIASHLRADAVSGALVAGDFNAIQPFDQSLHTDNSLKDAYLELGGQQDASQGHTWGQQALPRLRDQFGCSRMDKIFFCGQALKLLSFDRFGAGVVVDDTNLEDHLLTLGFERPWVTDHLGVKAVFGLQSGHKL
jgi:tyrosyl-DNA phosphodiesterase 2